MLVVWGYNLKVKWWSAYLFSVATVATLYTKKNIRLLCVYLKRMVINEFVIPLCDHNVYGFVKIIIFKREKKKHEKFLLSSKFFLSVKIPCSTDEASAFTSRSIASASWPSVVFSHFPLSHLPPPFLWQKLTGLGIYWETMTAVNIPYRRTRSLNQLR